MSWEDADAAATRDRLAEAGVVIRDLPGTGLVRASVGAWNDDSDLERLLPARSERPRQPLEPDLLGEHPLGVELRRRRGGLEPLALLRRQRQRDRRKHVLEVLERARPDDRRRHALDAEQPRDRDLRHRRAMGGGDLLGGVDDLEVPLDRAPVRRLLDVVGGAGHAAALLELPAPVATGQEPGAERPPGITPSPAARVNGSSSTSIDRWTSEYCGCRLTNGDQPSRSCIATAQASSHAG